MPPPEPRLKRSRRDAIKRRSRKPAASGDLHTCRSNRTDTLVLRRFGQPTVAAKAAKAGLLLPAEAYLREPFTQRPTVDEIPVFMPYTTAKTNAGISGALDKFDFEQSAFDRRTGAIINGDMVAAGEQLAFDCVVVKTLCAAHEEGGSETKPSAYFFQRRGECVRGRPPPTADGGSKRMGEEMPRRMPVRLGHHAGTTATEGRWYGGEPIWATLQRQGGRGAALAWVGGQDPADPRAPVLMVPFDHDRSAREHVDQVLAWLDLPAGERPQLVMDYFQHYDVAAHASGPASPQAAQAKAELDAALAHLVEGLRARGLRDAVDLVVVSDHGMDEVPPEHVDWLDARVPQDAYDVVGTMVIGIVPRPGREAEVAALVGRHAHHACYAKDAMPAHWHYGRHARVPPIVCVPDPGWYLFAREPQRRPTRVRGEHGFDSADPAMRAVFVARGPSFREGVVLPAFDNVDVYPLLAHLLGIAPAPNDGSVRALRPALRDARAP